jgi:hypothetical protein
LTNRFRTALAGAVLTLGAMTSAQAQTNSSHLGPRLSYNFDAEAVGLGVQFGVPIAHHLEFYPSFDVFFVDAGSLVGINADLKYRIGRADVSWLYIGTGLNIASRSNDNNNDNGNDTNTDAGLNLFFGVESLKGRVHPFGEMRFTLSSSTTAQLAAGLNFSF